jgi:hypothetical protein
MSIRGRGVEFPLLAAFNEPERFSFAIDNSAGIRNANVFPEPVAAIPMASRPVSRIGQHCDWSRRLQSSEDGRVTYLNRTWVREFL